MNECCHAEAETHASFSMVCDRQSANHKAGKALLLLIRSVLVGKAVSSTALVSLLGVVICAAMMPRPLLAATNQKLIHPGRQWRDNRGRLIQAHGGGMTFYQGTYYWFGEDRSRQDKPDLRYVACYSSRDLAHWTFRGQVLKLADPDHLGSGWVLERPKVYVDKQTGRFVMYAHIDDARYKYARVMVAVSDRIDGSYHYVKSFRPLGEESRDIGQFVDDDGSAYLIFESRPTGGFFIAKLIDGDMNVQKTAFIRLPLEGGALVHYRGLYYVVGSHLTGWAPNPNVYATAPSLSGPWTGFKNIAPPVDNTYGAQSTMLFKVAGTTTTTVIFMGDLWKPRKLWDSRYLWMPAEIGKGSLRLPRPRAWSIDVKTGEVHFAGSPAADGGGK